MKLQVTVTMFFVMFVFGTLFADVASAETTTSAEWLANGKEITTSMKSEISGSFKLEDTETLVGKAAVKCGLILAGSVSAKSKGEVKEVLNLAKEKIEPKPGLSLLGTGAGSDCQAVSGCAEGTAASPIEVWPVELPWELGLFKMENGEILNAFGGQWGYNILCLTLGINQEDKCTGPDEAFTVQNDALTGDAVIPNGSKFTPNSLCLQSNLKATGVIEATEAATMKLESGELSTVS